MKEYPKIQSIFKRDEKTHKFIEGQWSMLELEYLSNNLWVFTEKVNGTNVRVIWDGEKVRFAGRTDNAQMPTFLYDKLCELFPAEKFKALYDYPLTLYGEGYGAKIQKGGGNYNPNGVDFVLFDVSVDKWWLKRPDVRDVAHKLEITIIPYVGVGTILDAVSLLKTELKSAWGDFKAEGLVLRPEVELQTRGGQRIITKLKHKDFQVFTEQVS